MGLTIVTAPATTVVDPLVFDDFAGICDADANKSTPILLDAGQDYIEAICKSRFVTQTWAETRTALVDGMWLQLNPVQSVTSITYVDTSGDTQTVDSDAYELVIDNQQRAYVRLQYGESWPASRGDTDGITITYVVGYGDRADVPGPLSRAIMTQALDAFENRAGETDIKDVLSNIIAPYRYFE